MTHNFIPYINPPSGGTVVFEEVTEESRGKGTQAKSTHEGEAGAASGGVIPRGDARGAPALLFSFAQFLVGEWLGFGGSPRPPRGDEF